MANRKRGPRKPYKFDQARQRKYLDAVRQGMRRYAAAAHVGITPATVCVHQNKSKAFRDALMAAEAHAETAKIDRVEDALQDTAESGNITAIMFFLQNRRPDRWKDKRAVTVAGDRLSDPVQNEIRIIREDDWRGGGEGGATTHLPAAAADAPAADPL